jgi:glutamine---fructose-6-phosphate transaminase (isomerizing)
MPEPDEAAAPFVPELRAHRPWVMEEMIASEAELIASMEQPELVRSAGEVGDAVIASAESGKPVVVSGCGTSEHGAMAIGLQLRDALRASGRPAETVRSRQAFEAWLDPQSGGIHIAVTHEGGTEATNAAMAAAVRTGARVAVITAKPESDAARLAHTVVVTPLHDRSWCHTVGYLSPILAGALIGQHVDGSPRRWDELSAAAGEALALGPAGEELGRRLGRVDHLFAVGSGVDAIAASELALKLREGARLRASAYPLETVLHGHLAAADERDGLLIILTEPSAREPRLARARQVLRAARTIGLTTAVLADAEVAAELGDPELASAGSLVLPLADAGRLGALVSSALGLQLLTVGLAAARGTNPDRIRREEEAYAQAAAVVGREGSPFESAGPREFGFDHGLLRVPDDFDAPLPGEVLREFEQ